MKRKKYIYEKTRWFQWIVVLKRAPEMKCSWRKSTCSELSIEIQWISSVSRHVHCVSLQAKIKLQLANYLNILYIWVSISALSVFQSFSFVSIVLLLSLLLFAHSLALIGFGGKCLEKINRYQRSFAKCAYGTKIFPSC